MRICKITNIKPDGKPWESQYGMMYPFYVVLEDGGAGTANCKTETPAYKVGETVGYDVTGNSPKGAPKLKITRNPKPGEGTVWVPDTHPDLEAANMSARYNEAAQRQADPQTVPQSGYARMAASTGLGRQNASAASGTPVNGQTVGMAVKAAVDIFIARNVGVKGPMEAQDWEDIENAALKIVSMSERIQSGESSTVPF